MNPFEWFLDKLIISNTRILKLSVREDFVIARVILTQCQRVTEGQTDGYSHRSYYMARRSKLCWHPVQEAQLPQRNSASAAHMEGGGLGPPAHSPSAHSGYTYAYGGILNPQQTYVKRAVH